jgi:hypothetical protein
LDNAGDATSFRIGRHKSGETNYSIIAVVGAGSPMVYVDPDLAPSVYSYRLWAYRGTVAANPLDASATISDGTDKTPPSVPQQLIATAILTGTAHVHLSWLASTDNVAVHHYRIERYGPAGTALEFETPTGTPPQTYIDDPNPVAAGVAYRYRVLAVDTSGNESGYSYPHLATTIAFQDDPLVPGVLIQAQHILDLRAAVTAVRALAVLGPPNWTYPTQGVPLQWYLIHAADIQDLQQGILQALTPLGFPYPPSFSNVSAGVTIQATHIEELRLFVQ